jgi:hypothetical protein
MTTKAMTNTIASTLMISDEIPAVNSALLAEAGLFWTCAKVKIKQFILLWISS